MFNRLRKQFNNPTAGGAPLLNDPKNENEQSGFICPICMTHLKSAEGLQAHFEEKHSDPNPPDSKSQEPFTNDKVPDQIPAVPHHEDANTPHIANQQNGDFPQAATSMHNDISNETTRAASVEDSTSLRDEINDLKSSLSEEKWYTAELKKELENTRIEKENASEESSTIQKQMSIAMATNEELAKQKEGLEKKASRMAQSIAELKALNDEYQSEKEAAEQRSENQIVELEKAAVWVRDLESQLLQRPGADDVMVLKKELVSVQTLMDQMTLESEEKGNEVKKEREELQKLLDEARAQAQLVQEEFDTFKSENARLKSQNEESSVEKLESLKRFEEEKEKLTQLHLEQLNTKQEELKNLESSLEKEQSYSQSLELETNRLNEDKAAMEKDISKLTSEFNKMVQLCDNDKEKIKIMTKEVEDLEAAKMETESKLQLSEEEMKNFRAEQMTALNDKDARYDELCAERDNVRSQLNEVTDMSAELKRKTDELHTEADQLRSVIKQSESDSSVSQQQLQIEIAQLKIKQDKLIEDKQQLMEEKSNLEQGVDSLRSSNEAERNSMQDQLLESERQRISFKSKATQLEEESGQKSIDIDESRSKLHSLQATYEDAQSKSHALSTELALKIQELETLKEKVVKSSIKLDEEVERREKASEDAAKLREERSHLMAQMEAGEGEAVARAQIAKENELLRSQKDEAEERRRKEASGQEVTISELRSRINETSLLLTSTQEQLRSSEHTIVGLRDNVTVEREKLVQAETETKAKSELLCSAEAAAATQRADIQNHLNTIKRSLEEKSKDYEKANDELLASRSLTDDLKSQMSNLRQDHHMELANIRGKLKVVEKERSDVMEDNERGKEEREKMKESHAKENERRKQDLRELESKHNERVASLQVEITEGRNEIVRFGDDRKREESLRARVEVELNQARRQLQQSEETHAAARLKLEGALEALESAGVELKELQEERMSLSKSLEATKSESSIELESLKDENEKERGLLQQEIEKLENQSKLALSDAESKLIEKNLEVGALKSSVEELRAERVETETKLTSDVTSHVESLSKLNFELESMKSALNEKDTLLDDSKAAVEELKAKLKNTDSDLEERTTLLTETEVELEHMKIEQNQTNLRIKSLEENSSALDTDKSALQLRVEEHFNSNKDLQEKLLSVEQSNRDITEELASYKEKLEHAEEEFSGKKKDFEDKEESLQAEIANLEEKIENLNQELQSEIESKETMRGKNEEELKLLQDGTKEKESAWNAERNEFEENVQSLEAAQSLLVSHKVELTNTVESLQLSLEREKKLTSAAEEATTKSIKAKDDIINAMKSQLESKNRELESTEADRVVAESRLQLEIGTLTENLNSTRAEWVASTQRVEAMTRDSEDLKGEMLVLNTTIQNNNDERRALLERCLQAEQQSEERSGKLAEMRRKLEDAHSAMHELGRENQALQVKHKTTISRQWTDDSTAVQCRACGRGFSITVRRHHCRHCGDIFCGECSSRSATVAASKNPVRVCERCYDELLTAG